MLRASLIKRAKASARSKTVAEGKRQQLLGTIAKIDFEVERWPLPKLIRVAGEDDLWSVALRYAGELGGFKLAGGVAYAEVSDTRRRIVRLPRRVEFTAAGHQHAI